MPPGPPKRLEDLAKILIPPACREEVLGDLYERYKNAGQYIVDVLSTASFIIIGRIIRTTPIQLLVIDALLVYGSFLAAAWYVPGTLVTPEGSLVRLLIPTGFTLLTLLVSDVFTRPLLSLALVIVGSTAGMATRANIYGFFLSLVLASTARVMFEPYRGEPQGAGGPAFLAGRASRSVSRAVRVRVSLIVLALVFLIGLEMLSRRGAIP